MDNGQTFSQRMGLAPIAPEFQLNNISGDLRNRLWSLLTSRCFDNVTFPSYSYNLSKSCNHYFYSYAIWDQIFKKSIDTIPHQWSTAVQEIREWYFKAKWNQVYDLIDFCYKIAPKGEKQAYVFQANQILEQENSGFRFVGDEIVPITDVHEIDSIKAAMCYKGEWEPISSHISTSLSLLSDKINPDFRNSIKESISAVESAARLLCGDIKATLGDATRLIERGGKLHPAMAKALSNLYGYTSDEGGIRHSMLDEPNLSFLDAKFMLVICTAFCNHLRGNSV